MLKKSAAAAAVAGSQHCSLLQLVWFPDPSANIYACAPSPAHAYMFAEGSGNQTTIFVAVFKNSALVCHVSYSTVPQT